MTSLEKHFQIQFKLSTAKTTAAWKKYKCISLLHLYLSSHILIPPYRNVSVTLTSRIPNCTMCPHNFADCHYLLCLTTCQTSRFDLLLVWITFFHSSPRKNPLHLLPADLRVAAVAGCQATSSEDLGFTMNSDNKWLKGHYNNGKIKRPHEGIQSCARAALSRCAQSKRNAAEKLRSGTKRSSEMLKCDGTLFRGGDSNWNTTARNS